MNEPIQARVGDMNQAGWIGGLDPGSEECPQCGHPWQEHLLRAESRPPVEGWIECPVEGCTCHQTWSLPPDTAAQIKSHLVAGESP